MNAKRPNTQDMVFHPIANAPIIRDARTGQNLRLDGWWKNAEGRTLFAALSSPGSILRDTRDIEVPRGLT